MNPPQSSPKILVAPLDWGLGHATRCVPIIRQLLAQCCTVLLAAEGKTAALLQQEFPDLCLLNLPGYRIEYAASGWELVFKMVAQIPKLLSVIKEEQQWLQKVVEEEKIDAVIADNRYGLQHPKIHSVFITHQLRIKAPVALAEDLLQEINYRYLNKFDECWVPDAPGDDSLAGWLSHPEELPEAPLTYIGTLSRFTQRQEASGGSYLLILLSGPEPQRSLLEKMILQDLDSYTKPVVLVRGLPNESMLIEAGSNVSVFNHLPAAQLEEIIAGANWVIARSGYSTVMDLAVLRKRSILIPTPGQTEQEYLASYLMKKNFAFSVEQKKFKLAQALSLAQHFKYTFTETNSDALPLAIQELVEKLRAKKSAF